MRVKPKSNDRIRTRLEKPYATEQAHDEAYAYLRRRHDAGTLLPIHGWTGDLVAGYADILGIQQ